MVMYDWESEFKTKEKRIWSKEKIAPQHLFTAYYFFPTISFFYFFFMKLTKLLVGFQVLNKVHKFKAHEEEKLGHFVFVDI